MKKYLLISALSLVPYTEAFADATVETIFEGGGKIIIEPKPKLESTILTPENKNPVTLPAGDYSITILDKDGFCSKVVTTLRDDMQYVLTSSKKNCGLEMIKLKDEKK